MNFKHKNMSSMPLLLKFKVYVVWLFFFFLFKVKHFGLSDSFKSFLRFLIVPTYLPTHRYFVSSTYDLLLILLLWIFDKRNKFLKVLDLYTNILTFFAGLRPKNHDNPAQSGVQVYRVVVRQVHRLCENVQKKKV